MRKGYVQHQGLHKNKPHYQFVCCIEGYKFQFRNYNAFKCHFYHHHQRSSAVSQYPTLQARFICEQPHCQKQLIVLKDLFCHLKSHISRRKEVHCPFKNCDKTFLVVSSFIAHSSRKHKHSTAVHVSGSECLPSVPSEVQSPVAESQSDEGSRDDVPEEDVLDIAQMKSLYMKNLHVLHEIAHHRRNE